jgi:hypothetical protein
MFNPDDLSAHLTPEASAKVGFVSVVNDVASRAG